MEALMNSQRDPTDPVSIIAELDLATTELNDLSAKLAELERALTPVELQVEEFCAAHEEGLWTRHVEGGEKFPPEALRVRLAHREMDAALLGRWSALVASRRRMEKRIASLKAVASAKQSILSALKEAARMDGSGLRRQT
jgi:hypothetical protein